MGERLAWARAAAGYKSARSAALDNDWIEATYRSHERSGRGFDMEWAQRYGRRYKVDPVWLLHGIGAPSTKHGIPIVGIAGAGPEGSVVFSQDSDADLGEAPWAPNVTAGSVAVEVRGDSMRGIAENGWLVYFDDRRDPPTDDLLGLVCVVWLADGRVLIKKLMRGRKKGHFDLESAAAATMHDQKVEFAAEVRAIVPRSNRATPRR